MNDITRSDFGGNNGWTACEFVYSLLNGGTYRLGYWRRGDERLVYCKDLYESIGELPATFSRNFNYRKFDNEVKMQGTNNRSYMCAFSDALLYAKKQTADASPVQKQIEALTKEFQDGKMTAEEFAHGVNELETKRGEKDYLYGAQGFFASAEKLQVAGWVAREDGDLIGCLQTVLQCSREQASAALVMSTPQAVDTLSEACMTDEQYEALELLFDKVRDGIKAKRQLAKEQERTKQLKDCLDDILPADSTLLVRNLAGDARAVLKARGIDPERMALAPCKKLEKVWFKTLLREAGMLSKLNYHDVNTAGLKYFQTRNARGFYDGKYGVGKDVAIRNDALRGDVINLLVELFIKHFEGTLYAC